MFTRETIDRYLVRRYEICFFVASTLLLRIVELAGGYLDLRPISSLLFVLRISQCRESIFLDGMFRDPAATTRIMALVTRKSS